MFEPLPGSRMRRRIYLMRHGEVAYFDKTGKPVEADLVDLTDIGQNQARAMGEFLREVPFDFACHTDMPRTRQTAEGALAGRDVPLLARPGLREIHSGDMSALTKEEVKRDFIHVFERLGEPGLRYGRGEVIEEFAARVTGEVERLALEPDWTTILIVAHEVTNRFLLSWAATGDLRSARGFEQDPGCLNIIDIDVADRDGTPVLGRRFIKAMNITPLNVAKLGNNLASVEQLYALRKQRMREMS